MNSQLIAHYCRTLSIYLLSIVLATQVNAAESFTAGGITELTAPPYIWIDQCNQQPLGTTPHYINEIFDKLGFELSYAPPIRGRGSIGAFQREITVNNYDLLIGLVEGVDINGITKTKSPIVTLKSGLITRHDDARNITRIEQLKGLKGSISGVRRLSLSSFESNQINANELQLTEVTFLSTALDDLLAGKLDYVIGSKYPMMRYAEKIKQRDAFNFSLIPEISINFYLAINNNSRLIKHIDAIDNILENIPAQRADYLERSYLIRWLDDDKKCKNTPEAR